MTSNLCINRLILALTLCGGLPFTSKAELNYSDKAIVQQSTIKVKGTVVDEQRRINYWRNSNTTRHKEWYYH